MECLVPGQGPCAPQMFKPTNELGPGRPRLNCKVIATRTAHHRAYPGPVMACPQPSYCGL